MNLQIDPGSLTLGGLAFTSFVLALSGAVMPGPVMAVTITHAARMGVKAGPLMIAGHAVLELILVLALVGGLGSVLVMPAVSGGVGALGSIILLILGLDMLRGLPRLKLDWQSGAAGGPESFRAPMRDGFLLSLANPYWSLWWSTVGLSLMALTLESGLAWLGVAALFLGHISGDLAWYTLLSLVVAKGRRWLTDRLHRAVVGVCAVFLLGFAVYFGLFAWRQLAGLAG